MDSIPVDPDCDWGPQEIRKALMEADECEEEGDLDSANLLRAQANAAQAKLNGGTKTALEPYDPMRLMARVVRNYNGGITDAHFERMDYKRFFGYVRELDIMLEEENEASKDTGKKGNHSKPGEIQAALNEFPKPQPYEGETIQLI